MDRLPRSTTALPDRRAVPILALAALAAALAFPSSQAGAQATLTCDATIVNAVGAHAGALSLRLAATVDCSSATRLDFTLPGGRRTSFATDASGAFQGVIGEGYVCAGRGDTVALLATATAGGATLLSALPIVNEPGTPAAPPGGPGRECDVLLGPGLNYLAWGGPLALVQEAFSTATLGAFLPRSDNESPVALEHITSISSFDPGTSTWGVWIPGAPAAANTLKVLKPGIVYAIRADADIELNYPVVAAP
jgi:hypothetical protein